MQTRILQAQNEAIAQIGKIDARCIAEKNRLFSQQKRVNATCLQEKKEAKAFFDELTAPDLANKKLQLAPFRKTFRAAVTDINGRYQAYLRSIGVA
jgi:hypothetical protein